MTSPAKFEHIGDQEAAAGHGRKQAARRQRKGRRQWRALRDVATPEQLADLRARLERDEERDP